MTTATQTPVRKVEVGRTYSRGERVEGKYGEYLVFDSNSERIILISDSVQRGRTASNDFIYREIHESGYSNLRAIYREQTEFNEYLAVINQHQGVKAK